MSQYSLQYNSSHTGEIGTQVACNAACNKGNAPVSVKEERNTGCMCVCASNQANVWECVCVCHLHFPVDSCALCVWCGVPVC